MLVKIEARILIFPGTDFHFTSTAVPPGTFLGSAAVYLLHLCCSGPSMARCRSGPQCCQFSYFVARSSYFCTFPSYKNCLLATFYRQQLATLGHRWPAATEVQGCSGPAAAKVQRAIDGPLRQRSIDGSLMFLL